MSELLIISLVKAAVEVIASVRKMMDSGAISAPTADRVEEYISSLTDSVAAQEQREADILSGKIK